MRKRKSWFSRHIRWGFLLGFIISIPQITLHLAAIPNTSNLEASEPAEVAVILGAETNYGRPSAVLRHRIERGVDLYVAGKVDKLVMSGRAPEPEIMQEYAVSLGVSEEDILQDNGGIRTYATCYNTITQLELEEAIFVTQRFHLPRTLFLCQSLGIDARGVPAQHGPYWPGSWVYWTLRETLAIVLALSEVYFNPPDTSEYANLYQQGVNP